MFFSNYLKFLIPSFRYTLSFLQVDIILRTNEYTHEFHDGSVKSYDSNQLASNNPIEDTRSEASCLFTTGKCFRMFLSKIPLLDAINYHN